MGWYRIPRTHLGIRDGWLGIPFEFLQWLQGKARNKYKQ